MKEGNYATNAGISLTPDIIRAGRDRAQSDGLKNLSALVHKLLVGHLNNAGEKVRNQGKKEGSKKSTTHAKVAFYSIKAPKKNGTK